MAFALPESLMLLRLILFILPFSLRLGKRRKTRKVTREK